MMGFRGNGRGAIDADEILCWVHTAKTSCYVHDLYFLDFLAL